MGCWGGGPRGGGALGWEAFHFQEVSSAFHPTAPCFELKHDFEMSRINQPK